MIIIKNKTILTSLIIISLFFVVPYVESFSFGELSDMVGFVLFNTFDVITGDALYPTYSVGVCDIVSDPECTDDNYGGGGGGGSSGVCGNGEREEGEGCDSGIDGIGGTDDDDFGTIFPDCESRGDDGGELQCTDSCDLIQDGCYYFDDGDCESDFGETCENSPNDCAHLCIIPPPSCSELMCSDYPIDCNQQHTLDCTLEEGEICEFGECVAAATTFCGDGIVQEPNSAGVFEECDGADFGTQSCITLEYDSGALSCREDCTISESACEYDCVGLACVTPDDRTEITQVTTCAAINGICTNECGTGYEAYSGIRNLDQDCVNKYGAGLVCCVPSYILNAGYVSDSGDYGDAETSSDEFTGNIKSVEDYTIQNQQEAAMSAPTYVLEGGMQEMLNSPSYAMGGVWVIFVLTAVIIGMTYYLDASVASRLRFRRRK